MVGRNQLVFAPKINYVTLLPLIASIQDKFISWYLSRVLVENFIDVQAFKFEISMQNL